MLTYNNSKFLGYIIQYTILNFSELLYNYTVHKNQHTH